MPSSSLTVVELHGVQHHIRSETSKTNLQTFGQALLGSELFTSPASTADTFAEQLVMVVTRELDKMAPLRTPRNKRRLNNNTKWLSAEAVKTKRLRRRLEKRWITSSHDDDRTAYCQACRKTNWLINESRRSYHSEMIDGCTDSKKCGRPSRKSCTHPSAILKSLMRIIKSGVNSIQFKLFY